MAVLLNFIIGVACIFYGLYTDNNIIVTMGCMNLIMAKLISMEKK